MEIKRIKVEVEFRKINIFDYFEYEGEMYIRLPALTCKIPEYYGHARFRDVKGDFNSVKITNHSLGEYRYFKGDVLVKSLKTELKIYE